MKVCIIEVRELPPSEGAKPKRWKRLTKEGFITNPIVALKVLRAYERNGFIGSEYRMREGRVVFE